MNRKFKAQKGFTLIEVIIYVVIVVIMLNAMISFSLNIINGSIKTTTGQEVYSAARYLSERKKREVRDASAVTTCNATTLELANSDAAKDPTTIVLMANEITITQGTEIPSPGVRLHSADTTVSSTSFCTNYTGNNTDNVQITFSVSGDFNSSTRQEYNESIDIQFSAETRE